jgi:hypothetical protein
LLLDVVGRESEFTDREERLLVGIGAGGVKVVVGEGGEGLHVQLVAIWGAVEAPGREVSAAAFFEQAARRHLDPGRGGHQRVGVLHGAVALGIGEVLVLVALDAVELDQPVLEPRRRLQLA